MNKDKQLFIILLILLVSVVVSFAMLMTERRVENYVLFGFALLLFTIVYCVMLLDVRITGSSVGIERAKREIEQSKEQMSLLARNMFKTAFILADGSARWGGTPPEHKEKIREYMESLDEYLDANLDSEIQADIKTLAAEIEARNKKQD